MGLKGNADGARRGWIQAAALVLIAFAGLAILMLVPGLDADPLVFISPG